MNFYPYNSPIILTDDIYESYAGSDLLGLTTTNQRQAAYWMAEEKASEDIGTLLLPTTITGSYSYSSRIVLEHAWVHTIYATRFIDFEGSIYHTITGMDNIYLSLYDDERGLVDLAYAVGNCHCHTHANPHPYKVQIAYQAGLPSGTSYRPDVLMSLTTYASIVMNEIIGYGNEAPGDAGIAEFSNQQYREKRRGQLNTVFGDSPRARWAWRQLTRLRRYRYVSL